MGRGLQRSGVLVHPSDGGFMHSQSLRNLFAGVKRGLGGELVDFLRLLEKADNRISNCSGGK